MYSRSMTENEKKYQIALAESIAAWRSPDMHQYRKQPRCTVCRKNGILSTDGHDARAHKRVEGR